MEFLVSLKKGTNHQLFNKAREYFKTKGVKVIRYYFNDDNPSRLVNVNEVKSKLTNSDSCAICGMDLFRIEEKSRYSNLEDSQFIKIVMKKHLVFNTSEGKDVRTCYGINRCYERVGYVAEENNEVMALENFKPPSLKEFVGNDIDLAMVQDYKLKSVEHAYVIYMQPFIEKWFSKSLSKTNVIEFINDLKTIESKFINLYCNPASIFKKKVYKIIGLNYEK